MPPCPQSCTPPALPSHVSSCVQKHECERDVSLAFIYQTPRHVLISPPLSYCNVNLWPLQINE